ncbi:MAG: bifunctional DNA primase/polymerase, partial [Mycobacterium sp.]
MKDENRAHGPASESDTTQLTTRLHVSEIPADTDTLAVALAHTAAGFYALPVERRSKHAGSVVGNGWQHKSSRDPQVIAAWFAGTDHGIALHCGRSGATVFDVDSPDQFPEHLRHHLFTAPYQSTRPGETRRGHYLFATPPGRTLGNSTGKLGGVWGEVRGLNGVIIVAPSVHAEGGEYRWQRTGPLPVLPNEIAELLPDAATAVDAATDAAVAAFLAEHQTATRPDIINGLKKAFSDKIEAGESVHMSAVSTVTGALKEARAGYYPAAAALDTLKPVFLNAVALGGSTGEVRTGTVAESEWAGILAWAVAQTLAADLDEVHARVAQKMPDETTTFKAPEPERVHRSAAEQAAALENAHTVFRRWLGADYDTDALDVVLVAVAVEGLDGDPLWVLLISGPGNAKTETVQACDGVAATIVSTISSEGALLSATAKRERTKDATGGLLRKIGSRGVLVVKDVTSILSMSRELRGQVLAALREVYDGRWSRNVGTDGGRPGDWAGRVAVIGAVTTAWDTAHAVVSSMGDRFLLIRMDSGVGRQASGRKAIGNTGSETEMRAELAATVADVLKGMNRNPVTLTDTETDTLLAAADLVTRARTGVEYDYRGDVIDAHAPEMPTRFAKQLT